MARRIAYRPAVVQGQARPSPDDDHQRGVEPAGPCIFDTSKMWPKTIWDCQMSSVKTERMSKLSHITIVLVLAGAVAACGDGISDPAGRPRDHAEYNTQMAAWEAASASGNAKVEDIPMLTREQKERVVREQFDGKADASDIKGRPGDSADTVRRAKEGFVAYYNAPYGTVEEREAWGRFMRAVHEPPGGAN